MKKIMSLSLAILLLLLAQSLYAQLPQTISYQGIATNTSGEVLDGTYNLTVKLYTSATSSTPIWQETFYNYTITQGLFELILGASPLNPLPPITTQLWLGLTIDSGPELSPRTPITSVPYSIISKTVENEAITREKIAPGNIYGSASIYLSHFAPGTIGAEDIADGAIDELKLFPNSVHGSSGVYGPHIYPFSIAGSGTGGFDIDLGTIGTDELADGAVTEDKIADEAVTEAKIANNAVVKSLNALRNLINLIGGECIEITTNEETNEITISMICEGGNFNGVLTDRDFTMINEDGETVLFIDKYTGDATFYGDITLPLAGGGYLLLGSYGFYILNENYDVLSAFSWDGTSFHTQLETYTGPVEFILGPTGSISISENEGFAMKDAYSNYRLQIGPDGSIYTYDENGEIIFMVNSDGSSYHGGVQTFAQGIELLDGAIVFPDGSSMTTAPPPSGFEGILYNTPLHILDQYETPNVILTPEGNAQFSGEVNTYTGFNALSNTDDYIELNTTNGLRIYDNGDLVTRLGINGYNVFEGINQMNSGWRIPTDQGLLIEMYPGGFQFPLDNGGSISMNFYEGLTISNSEQNIFAFDNEGNSYFHNSAYFNNSINVNMAYFANLIIDGDGIRLIDNSDATLFQLFPDGASTYTGLASYYGGLEIPFIDGSRIELGFEGAISMIDAGNSQMHLLSANGDAYHSGVGEFGEGISIITGGITFADGTYMDTAPTGAGEVQVTYPLFGDGTELNPIGIDLPYGYLLFGDEENMAQPYSIEGAINITLQEDYTALFALAPNSVSSANIINNTITPADMNLNVPYTFNSSVTVNGYLAKNGGGFHIDHPLYPEEKYLNHYFVESPELMNVYSGTITLDENGEAIVQMPDWFEALNTNFSYQLTCIGGYAPVYIAQEIKDRQFKIAGGKPGMKVSWQVTGVRQDPWAKSGAVPPVEQEKNENEKGKYLHPELYNQPPTKAIYK